MFIFAVFVKFLKEMMQDTRTEKAENSQLRRRVQRAKFLHSTAAPFCFDHNFFIRTSFLVILVPLERLESVESKYS